MKVGSRGLFRYSRIYQRRDGSGVPIQVACVADRDIVPDSAKAHLATGKRKLESQYNEDQLEKYIAKLNSNDGCPVKTFISPKWTFEYDLALSGLARQIHIATNLAKNNKQMSGEEKEKLRERRGRI